MNSLLAILVFLAAAAFGVITVAKPYHSAALVCGLVVGLAAVVTSSGLIVEAIEPSRISVHRIGQTCAEPPRVTTPPASADQPAHRSGVGDGVYRIVLADLTPPGTEPVAEEEERTFDRLARQARSSQPPAMTTKGRAWPISTRRCPRRSRRHRSAGFWARSPTRGCYGPEGDVLSGDEPQTVSLRRVG